MNEFEHLSMLHIKYRHKIIYIFDLSLKIKEFEQTNVSGNWRSARSSSARESLAAQKNFYQKLFDSDSYDLNRFEIFIWQNYEYFNVHISMYFRPSIVVVIPYNWIPVFFFSDENRNAASPKCPLLLWAPASKKTMPGNIEGACPSSTAALFLGSKCFAKN